MDKRKKIVLVGAGSAMFTQGLVADMILSPDVGPWELGLVDIDSQALETAEGVSRRMVEAREADIVVSASTDRCDDRWRGRASGVGEGRVHPPQVWHLPAGGGFGDAGRHIACYADDPRLGGYCAGCERALS